MKASNWFWPHDTYMISQNLTELSSASKVTLSIALQPITQHELFTWNKKSDY